MMKNFPQDKYSFYTATKVDGEPYRVIAVSTYAGRRVRGVAKCAPDDTFDMEKGKALAAARCAVKVAHKRLDRANRKWNEADKQVRESKRHLEDMTRYYDDSVYALQKAEAAVEEIEKSL